MLAVAHLHANKVYHKDVKPENVLVSEAGHVTLIDFNVSEKFKENEVRMACQGGTKIF